MTRQKPIKIILASTSPRRHELLKGLGIPFEIVSANIDESFDDKEPPVQLARRLAQHKAQAVADKLTTDTSLIISGDTIVVLGKKILGKPKSKQEARIMLKSLSGKTHLVITGLCVMRGKKKLIRHVITKVTMRKMTKGEINNYVLSGEPMDKAGAYAIQGIGSTLVRKINGDYFNVVGLPLVTLVEMLKEFKVEIM